MESIISQGCGVRVRKIRPHRFVLDPAPDNPVLFLQPGTIIIPLGDKDRVFSQDGEELFPSVRFWRTAETIDPYHVLLDCRADGTAGET